MQALGVQCEGSTKNFSEGGSRLEDERKVLVQLVMEEA